MVPHHCVLVGSGDHWFGVLLRKSVVELEPTMNIIELVYLESNNIAVRCYMLYLVSNFAFMMFYIVFCLFPIYTYTCFSDFVYR